MQPSDLLALIPILAQSEVKRFEYEGLKIVFKSDRPAKAVTEVKLASVAAATLIEASGKPQEAPIENAAPELTYDQLLHWSGSSEESVPGTGDQPLNDAPTALPGESTPQP